MGQAQSDSTQDDNCFRACIKQKRQVGRKMQAVPHHPQKHIQPFPNDQMHHQDAQNHAGHAQHPRKQKIEAELFETSLEQRLYNTSMGNKKKCMVQYSTDIMTVQVKQHPLVEGHLDTSNQYVLGLQSKCLGDKINPNGQGIQTRRKGSTIMQGGSPITRANSNEKESGSQTETTSKSNRTSFSSRSRNILLNKIESIKQKYYERELQIEIYQDEREYEEQINQINQIERTFTLDNSCLPEQSIGEIKVIREKILKKLREKKQEKPQENILPPQDQSINADRSLYDQLQLYSREGKVIFDETINESQRLKKSKRMKKINTSTSGRGQVNKSLNRSLNGSLPEVSTDQKIQFSEYSEQSLHQIRELDEQEEEYRSKMSAMHHLNHLKPPSSNLNQEPSKQSTRKDFKQEKSARTSKLQQQISKAGQSQLEKSKGVQSSKGNKILLF